MNKITIRLFSFLALIALTSLAQQTHKVDFLRINATISVDPAEESVEGRMWAEFKILKDTDSIYLDAVGMRVLDQDSSSGISVTSHKQKIWLTANFKKDQTYKAIFRYKAYPKQALYFTGDQVWTQGQGKYSSNWLPSLDDMNDKIEFDLSYRVPRTKTLLSNGRLLTVSEEDEMKTWAFDMQHPMSSYLAAFAMGHFNRVTRYSASGIPIELYYQPQDSLKVEPTYRHTVAIFDFLEEEIGVSYPWVNYKQVPVRDFLYAGMENTTATIFSQAFVVDSIAFNDRNYVNVNAHELAHQWFGNLVTEKSGEHHWLQEGFATYYAQLAEREVFGSDYFYWKLYQNAEQLIAQSQEGKGESLLNPAASSLTFYEKGAWALHILRDLIGDDAFRRAVMSYLDTHAYQNVETSDFIQAVKAQTTVDIGQWERDWLLQTAFPSKVAFDYLKEESFMESYFSLVNKRRLPFSERIAALAKAIDSGNEYLGQEAVYQLAEQPATATRLLYKRAMETGNLYLRQAVVTTAPEINGELITYLENALDDSSYLTREYALLRLWSANPSGINHYLDRLDGQQGFQDLNIRQLWLSLAIFAKDYRAKRKQEYITELKSYSTAEYSFEIRQKAFDYLSKLGMVDKDILDAMVNAAVHDNWRFRTTVRKQLESLIRDQAVADYLQGEFAAYTVKEQAYLKTLKGL